MPTDNPECRCILCHVHEDQDELDLTDQHTVEHVQARGWSVKMIPEDDHGPGFAYTVGLWHTHRSPELAMFGLDVRLMHVLLNDLADEIAAGRPAQADEERHDLLERHPVVLKTVDLSWYREFFGCAISFYRRLSFPVLEVLWPDRDGRFPWNTGYDEQYRELQPHLWLNPEDHPTGVWTKLIQPPSPPAS
ncbi:DUF4262 domain-containing protein [Nonomuraea sp. NPDC048881]|uniref:DUF4262 domain-containing protein n=1 Tax=Nonomuraea sp. NPDC048881 TaxID=3155030 RepID=UPI0033C6F94C